MEFGRRKESKVLQKMLGAIMAGGCVMANSGVAEAEVRTGFLYIVSSTGNMELTESEIIPREPSNNNVVVNENNTQINGIIYDYEASGINTIYGGQPSEDDKENNSITLNAPSLNAGAVISGGSLNGNTTNNVVDMNAGSVSAIVGGESNSGNVSNNTVNFNGGTVMTIYGGNGNENANVFGNTVNINNGNINSYVIGGHSDSGNVSHNSIVISGGTIAGGVVAGEGNNVDSNSVNIYNSPSLDTAGLYGSVDAIFPTNNSLNMHTKNLTVQNIGSFQNLNFYLDSNIQNGDTMLTVTGTADISGAQVSAIVEGDTPLTDGDSVTLLNASTLTTDDSTTYRGVLAEGVSFEHQVTVQKVDDNRIVATIGEGTTPTVSPDDPTIDPTPTDHTTSVPVSDNRSVNRLLSQTEAIGQTPVVELQIMKNGFDRIIDWLPPEDFDIEQSDTETKSEESISEEDTDESSEESEGQTTRFKGSNGFEIFANMGGSSMRTKTGHGSYVDTKSGGMDIGAARTLGNTKGKLTFAPIFDYGSGSYDTHLGSGVRGSGNARYWAGGMIARQTNDDGFYYEGSFRMGRTDADFVSNDFRQAGRPVRLTYDVSSNCYAGHIRVGKVFRLNKQNTAHFYAMSLT